MLKVLHASVHQHAGKYWTDTLRDASTYYFYQNESKDITPRKR